MEQELKELKAHTRYLLHEIVSLIESGSWDTYVINEHHEHIEDLLGEISIRKIADL